MTGPGGRGSRRRAGRAADAVAGEKGPRTPEQERRAAERARRIRERRAAERAEPDGTTRSSTARAAKGAAATPSPSATAASSATATEAAAEGEGPTTADEVSAGPASGGSAPEQDASTPAPRSTGRKAGRAPSSRPSAARRSAADARYRRRRAVAVLLTSAVLLAGLAAGGWWALGRFGPAVDEVRVSGNRTVGTPDLRAAAAIAEGIPLASVDTDAVQSRVAGVPGVATAEIGRDWPHTLTVAVTERVPVAVVDTPGGRRMVDATGLAYRPVPPNPPRLPLLELVRVAPDDPAAVAAVVLLSDLPIPIRDQVDAVVPGPGGTTLELVLTDERRVLWGRWSDGADTARKAAVLGPLLSREGSVYDVSSPELPTVRR